MNIGRCWSISPGEFQLYSEDSGTPIQVHQWITAMLIGTLFAE